MQPSTPLNSGQHLPLLGFGTWQLQGNEAYQAVQSALKFGYRHLDTADRYHNHQEVGQAIKDSNIPRKDIFLTTKIWRDDLASSTALQALPRFLKELQVEYLDLLLIHWPNRDLNMSETFQLMVEWQEQGLIRSYGVSNFTIHHLQDMAKHGYQPAVNQVEFHPSLNQQELKAYCDQQNIVLTAYSPIAQGHDLKLPIVQQLAKKYERSESQVVLNWLRQKNIVAIPRSSNESHIQDNFASLDWNLDSEDVEKLDKLNKGFRVVKPEFAEFDY